MSIDKSKFIVHYTVELEENINQIISSLSIMKNDPENENELTRLVRAFHTVKGSSRMLKIDDAESVAHAIETVYKGVKDKKYPFDNNILKATLLSVDALTSIKEKLSSNTYESGHIPPNLLKLFEKIYNQEPVDPEELAVGFDPAETGKDNKTAISLEDTVLKIPIENVNSVIKELNNYILKQFQLNQSREYIQKLETSLAETKKELSDARVPASVYRNGFLDMEKNLADLRTGLTDSLGVLEKSIMTIQSRVESFRMLPLEMIFDTIRRTAVETALQVDKKTECLFSGGEVLIDRTILEALIDPCIHLIRNSVDHGIETENERIRLGKNPMGKISVTSTTEHSNLVLSISDDGAGIDYEKVRKKAAALFPERKDEIASLSEESLSGFLFSAGFSTKDSASLVSGRGVGLDIVDHNLKKVKGKITLRSKKGSGTTFIISVPMSVSTIEGFFVKSIDQDYFIPSTYVKEVLILDSAEIMTINNKKNIRHRDAVIPLHYMSYLDGMHQMETLEKLFVFILDAFGEQSALCFSSVENYSNIVFKQLPENLRKQKAILGVVFDRSYNLVPILYIPEIIKKFKAISTVDFRKRFDSKRSEFRHILIVDDSFSTREIEKSIVETENFNVDTAVDGIDALEKLKIRNFDLVVTDINMPRMDGLTLIENMKRQTQLAEIPVIVVTGLEEDSNKEVFMEKGAAGFIVKGHFERGNLLKEINRLLR